jgi:hypothetical protein
MPPDSTVGTCRLAVPGLDNRSALAHMTPRGHDDGDETRNRNPIGREVDQNSHSLPMQPWQVCWPPPGRSRGRQRALFTAAAGHVSAHRQIW